MQLQHIELFSGIGGMRLSVACVLPKNIKHVCNAVDVNANANRVYQYNFGDQPATLSLEYCSAADLTIKQQQHAAAAAAAAVGVSRQPLLWTLSPPCQPYTKTAHSKQQDAGDTRATSFSHILGLLPTLQQPPTHILLENVVTFYNSQSHQQMHKILGALGYQVFDVALCPSQLGIPHLRPRHYTLAKLKRTSQSSSNSGSTRTSVVSAAVLQQLVQLEHGRDCQVVHCSIGGLSDQHQQQHHHQEQPLPNQQHMQASTSQQLPQLQKFLELDWSQQAQPLSHCSADVHSQVARYALPLSKVTRYFKLLDVVTPTMSHHSNCFTKGYAKSIMGTGSYVMEDAAARLLARMDSRGRFHLTEQPYTQKQLHGSSNCKATTAATDNGSAACGDAIIKPPRFRAVDTSADTPQQIDIYMHGCTASQPNLQQDPQTMRRCHEVQESESFLGRHQQHSAAAATSTETSAVPERQIPPVLRVRRFTPREVAKLMGFPDWFEFPQGTPDRQAYALLGNSLSVDAVTYLARLLLEDVIDGSFYSS